MKLLVIGDLHSNFKTLKSLIAKQPDADAVLSVGDLGLYFSEEACKSDKKQYARTPNLMRSFLATHESGLLDPLPISVYFIKGNHDDVSCKKIIPNDFNIVAAQAIQYSIDKISVDDKKVLNNLSPIETVTIDEKSVQFCHGSPQFPLDEYTFNFTSQQDAIFEFMNFIDINILFLGHTHIPYIREVNGKIIANPGSSSQPRDGDNRQSYIVSDIKNGLGKIERV